MIDGVHKMGVKFMQERETIHLAIELIDSYYLSKSQSLDLNEFRRLFMHPKMAIEHQVTCLLIASKLLEFDENIVLISHLREYIAKQLEKNNRKLSSTLVPSFDAIVECERRMMLHFDWDLNFILPCDFVRLFLA